MSQDAVEINCPSCGDKMIGKFCSNCGEKRIDEHDFSMTHYAEEALDIFTHFDSKFFKSIKSVLIFPGKLSAEFFKGRRKIYMKPLQLFLIVNLVYFLATTYVIHINTFTTPMRVQLTMNPYYGDWANEKVKEKLVLTGQSLETYSTKFDEKVAVLSKTLIVLMIPMFALCFYILFFRKKKYFTEHLVVSTHFFSFYLLMNIVILPLIIVVLSLLFNLFSIDQRIITEDSFVSSLIVILMIIYMTIMFRVAYKVKKWYAITGGFLIGFTFFYIVWLYRFILFVTTLQITN